MNKPEKDIEMGYDSWTVDEKEAYVKLCTEIKEKRKNDPIRVAVIGITGDGKSYLCNCISGFRTETTKKNGEVELYCHFEEAKNSKVGTKEVKRVSRDDVQVIFEGNDEKMTLNFCLNDTVGLFAMETKSHNPKNSLMSVLDECDAECYLITLNLKKDEFPTNNFREMCKTLGKIFAPLCIVVCTQYNTIENGAAYPKTNKFMQESKNIVEEIFDGKHFPITVARDFSTRAKWLPSIYREIFNIINSQQVPQLGKDLAKIGETKELKKQLRDLREKNEELEKKVNEFEELEKKVNEFENKKNQIKTKLETEKRKITTSIFKTKNEATKVQGWFSGPNNAALLALNELINLVDVQYKMLEEELQ